jgi:hypothetical protein
MTDEDKEKNNFNYNKFDWEYDDIENFNKKFNCEYTSNSFRNSKKLLPKDFIPIICLINKKSLNELENSNKQNNFNIPFLTPFIFDFSLPKSYYFLLLFYIIFINFIFIFIFFFI